jgi:autotransporter strand-loop-strand O-heptosyltransferase
MRRSSPNSTNATYSTGLFFDDKDFMFQPCDFRHVGLHRTAGYILGVDPTEMPPRIAIPDSSRPIAEPYVVIGTQSTVICPLVKGRSAHNCSQSDGMNALSQIVANEQQFLAQPHHG